MLINDLKKTSYKMLTICALSALLCGCGSVTVEGSHLEIDKDGKITSIISESFEKDYYDISELSDMASDEISYYNSEYDLPKITLVSAETDEENGKATLTLSFEGYSDYTHFNQIPFFYGTVSEAMEAGYTVSGDLINASGEGIDISELDKYMNRHIIITNEKTEIVTPYNIGFATPGVVIRDTKHADLSRSTAESVQILLSK